MSNMGTDNLLQAPVRLSLGKSLLLSAHRLRVREFGDSNLMERLYQTWMVPARFMWLWRQQADLECMGALYIGTLTDKDHRG